MSFGLARTTRETISARARVAAVGHAHVEGAVEAEREAAVGLVELHRGDADVHHHAVDGFKSLTRANLAEMREAVFHQRQPAFRPVHEVEPAGDGSAVAVDADDAGSPDLEDSSAVAARAEGRVDVDAAFAGLEHLDRLAAEH